ncbi:MAG: hypothetical protein EPO08_00815 [Rhodospirillaceae bacterium]|nr:MAG: hypothetical protein EPO08_00815 [Rhodospirillaceae bacterium]
MTRSRLFRRVRSRGLVSAILIALLLQAMMPPARAQNLSVTDVDRIVGRAAAEAAAQGAGNGAIAVVDRVGNVLGVYLIDPNHPPVMTISSGRGIASGNGLEGLQLPAAFGAIAKAITGAYLSSAGNAFSTRTASQIVQENFNPGELGAPGGPLFGVQFSQLPCSDITAAGEVSGGGPRRSPLGLSADPGGLPLYINGQVVGGVGVMFDGIYGLDLDIDNYDSNLDELVAMAASQGYTPPSAIANRITVNGKLLRFADVDGNSIKSTASQAVNAANYIAVAGYTPGGRRDGAIFGSTASGVRPDGGVDYPGLNAWVLDDGTGNNRYAPRDSLVPTPTAGGISQEEAQTIVAQGLKIAFAARGQIRLPLGSFAQVTASVVDGDGNVLALARTPDQPIFGIDVAVQKARSVLFFSRASAAADLRAVPAMSVAGVNIPSPGRYADAMDSFVGQGALEGHVAYGDRSIGNLARPFYPDGINGMPSGPLSLPFTTWSPFNDGLQLDLVLPDIVARIDGSVSPASGCTALPQGSGPPASAPRRLANGLQIFPGGVPIYRGNTLIGAVGVSGDGIDQDDMVAFLGLYNAGVVLNSGIGNAPPLMRADRLKVGGIYLRYVSCPVAPFNKSTAENVCAGK